MNTKETAIEFVEGFKDRVTFIDIEEGNEEAIKEYNNKLDKVIALLQQGEKYRQIVEELIEETLPEDNKSDIFINWLRSEIKRLEQKYFPKEEAKQEKNE